ncbi:MAG: cation-translocating P-type ATPase [Patescibacteria group bacterium]|nr:cation-translocating P-type ATPase [Patescibacteria group bacterium]
MKLITGQALFEAFLSALIAGSLIVFYSGIVPQGGMEPFMVLLAFLGTAPVIFFAAREAWGGEWASMDMLASVALFFSLVSREWNSSAFIALMLSAARLLSVLTETRTQKSIEGLLELRPDTVKVRRGNQLETIPLERVAVGDTAVFGVGERVSIDGMVVSGEAAIDESSLTGESLPIDKRVGTRVFAGTLVADGGIDVRVDKIGKDTTLERIIALVESARKQKSRISTIGERFGKAYLILIFIFSGALYVISRDLALVLSVVLVVCADDVAIAIPLAYLTAIGAIAHRGVIVKGGAHLEALGRAKTFVFDKTGTLTKGKLAVAAVLPVSSVTEREVLTYASIASRGSNHPLSRAVIAAAEGAQVPAIAPEESRVIGGKGVSVLSRGARIVFGRIAYVESEATVPEAVREAAITYEQRGMSVSALAVNGTALGVVAFQDEIKDEAPAAIAALRALGATRLIMLTGDNEPVAKAVATKLGLDGYYAGLLPEDKVAKVSELGKEGELVMVGDGVNDAAALSAATVGIAMGAIGYDAAIESAQIVLMRDDLAELAETVTLARRVHRVAIEDFWIWGITNAFGLALVFFGIIGPPGAAAYNFISDFFPLGNSLRVRRISAPTASR